MLLNIASFTVDFRFLFKSSIMGLYNRKQFDPALKVFTVMEEVSSLGCACTYLLYLSSKPFAINSVFWSSKQIGRAPVEVELSCWISVREAGDVHVRRQRKLHCGYKGKKSRISFLKSLARQKRSIVVNASMQLMRNLHGEMFRWVKRDNAPGQVHLSM